SEVFDAVILDDSMPDMAPLDLLRLPRGESRSNIMVLTDEGTPELIAECAEAGAADLVVKPFNLPDLLIRVEKILENAAPE
ncbi:response regulator, partial [Nitrospinota bacterium]